MDEDCTWPSAKETWGGGAVLAPHLDRLKVPMDKSSVRIARYQQWKGAKRLRRREKFGRKLPLRRPQVGTLSRLTPNACGAAWDA